MRVKCTGSTVNIRIIGIIKYYCFLYQKWKAGNIEIERSIWIYLKLKRGMLQNSPFLNCKRRDLPNCKKGDWANMFSIIFNYFMASGSCNGARINNTSLTKQRRMHILSMIVLLWSIMFDQNPTTVFAFFFSKQKVIPKLWTVSMKIFKVL